MRLAFVLKVTLTTLATGAAFATPRTRAQDAAPAAPTTPDTAAAATPPSPPPAAPVSHVIGKPRRATPVALQVAGDDIVGRIGKGPELRIPAHGARDFALRTLPVGPQGAVLALDTTSPEGRFSTLFGGALGNELLASGRAELHGDPGERHGVALLADAEGAASVAWATVIEGVTACGDAPVPLAVSRVDAKTLKLVAARHALLPALTFPEIAASAQAESAEVPKPALKPLAFASSQLVPDLAMSVRPSELVDGDPGTGLVLRDDDFVQFKWPRSAPSVERIVVSLRDKVTQDASLWLRADGGKGAHVKVARGTDKIVIALADAWKTSCIALGVNGAGKTLPIAEVEVFSGLDRPEYVAGLVSKLVQDGPDGAQAAEQLASLGGAGAAAIVARFDELSTRGKQRALRVLGNALAEPAARDKIVLAARAKDESLSSGAIHVLADGGEPGRAELRTLAKEPAPLGDRAAIVLAQRPGELAALLDALLAPGGSERPVLRTTVVSQARREPEAFDKEITRLRAAELDPSQRTALAVAASAAGRPLALECIESAVPVVTSFEDRFRLAASAKDAGASKVIDAWLSAQSTNAEEWMQRFAAFDALGARNQDAAAKVAAQLAHDPYPRVRARAIGALKKGEDDLLLTRAAKDDFWPIVRVAGAEAIATRPELRKQLEELLEDPSRKVRAAVIGGLASQGARELWPKIEERLKSDNEWNEVRVAATRFAAELCVQPAREPLVFVARRGLRHEATEDDQFLAARALEALMALGGPASDDARLLVERAGAPEPLKKLLASLPPSACAGK